MNPVAVSNILTEISSQLPAVECQVRGEPGDSVLHDDVVSVGYVDVSLPSLPVIRWRCEEL